MQGKLYYNIYIGTTGMPVGGLASTLGGFACADLRTGEILWTRTDGKLDAGELRMESGGAVTPYLWEFGSTSWKLYHPTTGALIRTLTNATNTNAWPLMGQRGEILDYMLDGQSNRLVLWNSSLTSGSPGTSAWSTGIQWNISIQDVPGTPATRYIKESDVLLAEVSDFADRGSIANQEPTLYTHLAYNLKPGQEGKLLWAQNRTDIGDMATRGLSGSSMPAMNDGVYAIFERETLQNIVYDYRTGNLLWKADSINATTDPWSLYKSGSLIAYGKLYYSGYGGRVFAYDIKTGDKLWEYFGGYAEYQTPYNVWPFYGGFTLADGKIFIGNLEHSPTQPLWTGAKLHVINGETGEGVWNITGMFQSSGFAIADGYFIGFNAYDGQIYCFGKGKTATTVTASSKISEYGDTILIEGTVTDQSPDSNAKGTPAISDADMTSWMEYLHMQKPRPTDASGVEVSLNTIDPNNNLVHIGNVTSDSNGLFKMMWTPEVPGEYTIIASFVGSESYWSSFAETAIGVTEAALTPSPQAETILPPTEMYIIGGVTAIIVAIAIVGAVILLSVRK